MSVIYSWRLVRNRVSRSIGSCLSRFVNKEPANSAIDGLILTSRQLDVGVKDLIDAYT